MHILVLRGQKHIKKIPWSFENAWTTSYSCMSKCSMIHDQTLPTFFQILDVAQRRTKRGTKIFMFGFNRHDLKKMFFQSTNDKGKKEWNLNFITHSWPLLFLPAMSSKILQAFFFWGLKWLWCCRYNFLSRIAWSSSASSLFLLSCSY